MTLSRTAIAVPLEAGRVFDVMTDSFDESSAIAAGFPSVVLDAVFAQLVVDDRGTTVGLDPGAVEDLRAARWVLEEFSACAEGWAVDFATDPDAPATPEACRIAAGLARQAIADSYGTPTGRLEVVAMLVDLGRDGAAARLGGDAGLVARIADAIHGGAGRVRDLREEGSRPRCYRRSRRTRRGRRRPRRRARP